MGFWVSASLFSFLYTYTRWAVGLPCRYENMNVEVCRKKSGLHEYIFCIPFVKFFHYYSRATLKLLFGADSRFFTEISSTNASIYNDMVQHRCTSKWKRFSMRWCIHDGFVWEICYAFWFFAAI